MQKLIFTPCSKPNQSPNHMAAFATVVEDSWKFNFPIQSFCCTVQNFRANRGQRAIDRRPRHPRCAGDTGARADNARTRRSWVAPGPGRRGLRAPQAGRMRERPHLVPGPPARMAQPRATCRVGAGPPVGPLPRAPCLECCVFGPPFLPGVCL
jgi:hypothetical protein